MTFILTLDSFSPSCIDAFRDSVSYRVGGSFCTLKVTSPVTVTSLHRLRVVVVILSSAVICTHARTSLEKLCYVAVSDLNHSHYCCVGSTPDSPRVLSVWIRARFSSGSVSVDQGLVLLRSCLCESGSGFPHVLSVWIRTQFSSCSVCVDQGPVLLGFCVKCQYSFLPFPV